MKGVGFLNFTINKMISFFMVLLLILSTFYSAGNSILKYFGFAAALILFGLNLVFIFSQIMLNNNSIDNKMSKVIRNGILLVIWIMVGIIYSQSRGRGLEALMQIIFLLTFTFAASQISWKKENINSFKIIMIIFIGVHSLYLLGNFGTGRFTFYFSNPNPYAAIMYYLSFPLILMLENKKLSNNIILYLMLAVMSAIIILTKSISIWGACILSFIVYVCWPFISSTKFIHRAVFNVTVFFIMAFTYIYPIAYKMPNYEKINQMFFEYTGQRFFSGRNIFWSTLLELATGKIFLGYGTGVLPSDLIKTDFSAHNQYLQTLLQNGLIGIVLLVLLLKSIWDYLYIAKQDVVARLTSSFMIGIMVHQTFEVTLLQNNIAIGLLQWFIMAVGLSRIKTIEYTTSLEFKQSNYGKPEI